MQSGSLFRLPVVEYWQGCFWVSRTRSERNRGVVRVGAGGTVSNRASRISIRVATRPANRGIEQGQRRGVAGHL